MIDDGFFRKVSACDYFKEPSGRGKERLRYTRKGGMVARSFHSNIEFGQNS